MDGKRPDSGQRPMRATDHGGQMNEAKHMAWWMWVLFGIQLITTTYSATHGQAVQAALFGATAGGILGFGLRDWRARIDAEIERLRHNA
jgi:hypothetical protein